MARHNINGSAWSNANRLAGGNLVRILKRLNGDGESPRQIEKELKAFPDLDAKAVELGVPPPYRIDTSHTTITSWLLKLGVG